MAKIEPFPIFVWKDVRSNEHIDRHDYGIIDPWSRRLGCHVKTWEADYVVEERVGEWEHERHHTRERAERNAADANAKGRFHLYTKATRDGEKYGSSHDTRQFHTAEERDKAVAKYLKQAVKTAEKSVAKQAADRAARQASRAAR